MTQDRPGRQVTLRAGRLVCTIEVAPECDGPAFSTYLRSMQAALDEEARNTIFFPTKSGKMSLVWKKHPFVSMTWCLGYDEFLGSMYCWYQWGAMRRQGTMYTADPPQMYVVCGQWQVDDDLLDIQPCDSRCYGREDLRRMIGQAISFGEHYYPTSNTVAGCRRWCEGVWARAMRMQD